MVTATLTPSHEATQTRLIRLPQLKERLGGIGTSTVYGWLSDPEVGLPRPIRIGSRAVAWVEAEIDEWVANRAAERDAVAALTESGRAP